MANTRVMVMGGCNARGPLLRAAQPLLRPKDVDWTGFDGRVSVNGAPFIIYTLGEMIQAISCYQGHRRIPTELVAVCNIKPERAPTPANSPLDRADVILVEPNTSNEIEFRGFKLSRTPIQKMLKPLAATGKEGAKAVSAWYRKGIVAMDAQTRTTAAEKLIELIPADALDRELTVDILRHANGAKCDVQRSMQALVDMVDIPVGVVIYTWAYMADGRPISWPAEFGPEIRDAALALDLPMLDPYDLVRETGAAIAMKPDLRHYAETFMPVVARSLVDFAISTSDGGRKDRDDHDAHGFDDVDAGEMLLEEDEA